MHNSSQPPIYMYSAYYVSPHCAVSRYLIGRDSSVSIATRYRLDGPGIETGRATLNPTQPPAQRVPRLFPRGTVAGAWC